MHDRFWKRLCRIFAVELSIVTAGLAIFAGGAVAISFLGGAAVSAIALVMLKYTVSAYARTGLGMANGGSVLSGRFARGLLLIGRIGLVSVLLAGLVSWKNINIFALIGGVASVQVALIITVVLSTLGWGEKG